MILMAIICFQAPSLASALTGGAAIQQGIQMVQNAMMVAGLRSVASSRSSGVGGAGGVIRAGAGAVDAAGPRHRCRGLGRQPWRRHRGPWRGKYRPHGRLQAGRNAWPDLSSPFEQEVVMNKSLKPFAALLIAFGFTAARAQGIPVIDAANLVQTVQQVVNDITKINNQVQQITQLQAQLNSINGVRNLGNVFNNPLLRNYLPPESFTVVNAVQTAGYAGLSTTARVLRDSGMVYNCLDLAGAARTHCQAALAQPQPHCRHRHRCVQFELEHAQLHLGGQSCHCSLMTWRRSMRRAWGPAASP